MNSSAGGPRVLGCGEDTLTLWALTKQTGAFLNALHDDSSVSETTVFLRPSFGRGRRVRSAGAVAEFGELDGIVRTRQAIYLVEAKCARSGELVDDPVVLRDVQTRRHEVLRAYLESWRETAPHDWKSFGGSIQTVFGSASWGLKVAPLGSLLAGNLEFVLRDLADTHLPIVDVLLVLVPAGWTRKLSAPPRFRLVQLEYTPVEGSEFVDLT